ncbi:helix-turn-helix domain-containing protein [Streptomyces sp. NPDC058045]|uniref:MmyB family transcriptional regulator n=1 Tax=Streptomyces sp. NPDC058045 TaxID=3346311 RepID=UPI0036E02AAB
MDDRSEAREFLMSRRAKLGPEQAGLTVSGQRRVAGLRRGEVAALADVSPEYYAKIERGHLAGVSDGVLDAVARALRRGRRRAGRRHGSGTKNFRHHEAGDLTLTYEGLELAAEPGLSFLIYTAEPGSPSEERLKLLASWAASIPRGEDGGGDRAVDEAVDMRTGKEREKESRT